MTLAHDAPLLISVEKGAELAGIGRSKFYEAVLAGDCASIKIGRRRLVPRAALEAYVGRLLAEQVPGA
jgi:excisionase family DNA binding protein